MKEGLVDLHCHLLACVDDGAVSADDSVALLRAARAEGITRLVVTPHINFDRYANVASTLRAAFAALVQLTAAHDIAIELKLGAEVRASDELLTLIEREEIPFYRGANEQRTLLLEFPHSHLPPGWQQLLRWLTQQRIQPLIAHPERNKEVMKTPECVREMREAGALIQLTASALVGAFGDKAEATAKLILKKGWATLLASDAHNLRHRPPSLRSGAQAAATILGDSKAWDMVSTIPLQIAFATGLNR